MNKKFKKKNVLFTLIAIVAVITVLTISISAASTVINIIGDGTANFTDAKFYTLSSSNVTTYTTSSGTTVSGAIYPDDLCTVLSATGTYWKVSYPTSSGSKTAYCNKANIIGNTSYCKKITLSSNTTVYSKSNMSTSFGTVYTTDTIYMLTPLSNGKTQIIYNIDGGGYKIGWIYATEQSNPSNQTLTAMHSRAESIVNYQWTPKNDIKTWNGNKYKYPDGTKSTTFYADKTVTGMPYTLFSSELGFDSLLSLAQYKDKALTNYSTTKYCTSVSANRTGPAYGSCCATFVSEVFGGNFMSGSNPRYDGVKAIESSPYVKSYTANISSIKSGDSLITTGRGHIIWIGDVTSTSFVIYEQAADYAVSIKHNISKTSVNSTGYLTYDGSTYNTILRPDSLQ